MRPAERGGLLGAADVDKSKQLGFEGATATGLTEKLEDTSGLISSIRAEAKAAGPVVVQQVLMVVVVPAIMEF